MAVYSTPPEPEHSHSVSPPVWLLRVRAFSAYFRPMKEIFCLAALSLTLTHGFAAEAWWPQFRGPNCSGVSDTAHPPTVFGPGTNQLWKVAVPGGMSSPVVWKDRIFLTTFDAAKPEVHGYARKDGKLLWKQAV